MSKITKLMEDAAYSVYSNLNKNRKNRELVGKPFSEMSKSIYDFIRKNGKIK